MLRMGMAGAFGTFVRERYGMAGKDRGRADSRFLGDKAAFGMTKLRLPSNGTARPQLLDVYIRIRYRVYINNERPLWQ